MQKHELKIVSYWGGKLPDVAQVHFISFLNDDSEVDLEYHLFLDPVAYADFTSEEGKHRFNLVERDSRVHIHLWDIHAELHASSVSLGNSVLGALLAVAYGALNSIFNPQTVLARGWDRFFTQFGDYNVSQGFEVPIHLSGRSLLKHQPHISDFFRLAASRKFIHNNVLYVDLDVARCRPLREWLRDIPYVYQWPGEDFANSAVLFIPSTHFNLANQLLELARSRGSFRPWKIFTYETCRELGIEVLPLSSFDPPFDAESQFFKRPDLFFSQAAGPFDFGDALGFHWHNQWNATIEVGSPADRLCEPFLPKSLPKPGWENLR